MATPDKILASIITITFCFWGFTIMLAGLLFTRVTFAWAFDKIAPSWLADVSKRFKQPVKSIALFVAVCWFSAVLYNFYPTYIFLLVGGLTVVIALLIWLPDCVAAIVLPWRRRTKDAYEASPVSKLRIGPVPLIVIVAVVAMVWAIMIAYAFAFTTSIQSLAADVGIFVLGLIIYYAARYYQKTRGIDITLAFTEIPPE
jgi:amino acid transporter